MWDVLDLQVVGARCLKPVRKGCVGGQEPNKKNPNHTTQKAEVLKCFCCDTVGVINLVPYCTNVTMLFEELNCLQSFSFLSWPSDTNNWDEFGDAVNFSM